MPITDMREYIANAAHGAANAETQLGLMKAQRARLEQEAEALATRRRYVDLKIAYWQAVSAGDEAEVARIGGEARPLAEQIRAHQSTGER